MDREYFDFGRHIGIQNGRHRGCSFLISILQTSDIDFDNEE